MPKGLVIGDSVIHASMSNKLVIIQDGWHDLYWISGPGQTIQSQQALFESSVYYDDPDLDWIFMQVGVNNIAAGESAATIVGRMDTLLGVLSAHTPPTCLIYVGKMAPCRGWSGEVSYPRWVDSNTGYSGLTASYPKTVYKTSVSTALGDASDFMLPGYDHGDGLHVNTAGALEASAQIRALLDVDFPVIPPTPEPPPAQPQYNRMRRRFPR